jgi:hypothetical protein
MENIPVLYLDLTTCRQGLGDRQPSIEWVDPDQVSYLFCFNLELKKKLNILLFCHFED